MIKRALKYIIKGITCPFTLIVRICRYKNGFLYLILTLQAIAILGWVAHTYLGIFQEKKAQIQLPKMPSIPVEAVPVRIGSFSTFTQTVGTLKANESVIIKPEMDGRIQKIYFKSGQFVKKGDLLFTLYSSQYETQLNESKARLENARVRYKRADTLVKKKAGTVKDRDDAWAQLKIAEAEVEKSQALLDKTSIFAPFEGYIGLRRHSEGSYIRAGEEIVTLDDNDPIKVDFQVSERFIDKIDLGKEVEIEVEGFPDNLFKGKIEAVDSQVNELTHSIRVRAIFDNVENDLKPGLFARVKLRVSHHEGVTVVPESAVESRGSQEYVFVVRNKKAVRVPIISGSRNGSEVEVRSGLSESDKVIVAGQMKVQDGSSVLVVPARLLRRL